MGAVVLDTSVILALLDPEDALHAPAAATVRRHHAAKSQFALPVIVLAEVLVGTARLGPDELHLRRAQIITAFGSPIPVDEAVAVVAASLRARHRFLRMPDALVLATATVTAAAVVVTGDKKWSAVDPRVELVTSAEAAKAPTTEPSTQDPDR